VILRYATGADLEEKQRQFLQLSRRRTPVCGLCAVWLSSIRWQTVQQPTHNLLLVATSRNLRVLAGLTNTCGLTREVCPAQLDRRRTDHEARSRRQQGVFFRRHQLSGPHPVALSEQASQQPRPVRSPPQQGITGSLRMGIKPTNVARGFAGPATLPIEPLDAR